MIELLQLLNLVDWNVLGISFDHVALAIGSAYLVNRMIGTLDVHVDLHARKDHFGFRMSIKRTKGDEL